MAACPLVSSGLLVGICAIEVARCATSRAGPAGWRGSRRAAMWMSTASDAVCAASLQQALDDYGVVDTDALPRQSWRSQRLLPNWLGRCAQPFRQRRL
eukprot:6399563-Prymnesium_polylepis.1